MAELRSHIEYVTPAEVPLPWHRPEVECLIGSIDTAEEKGSGEDIVSRARLPAIPG